MSYHFIRPTAAQWDVFVRAHPDAHLLQLSLWGQHQSQFGWTHQIFAVADPNGQIAAGALVLYRSLAARLGKRAYIPAGPLFSTDDAANHVLWQSLRRCGASFVKIEPCNWYRLRPDLPERLASAGLRQSAETIQPPRTIVIDLAGAEEEILKRMNQSTRYKARLAPKKEVDLRIGTQADLESFAALMQITGERDEFHTRPAAYYAAAWELFHATGECVLIMASYAGKDLAGAMIFRCGENAYYLYGASSNEERQRMATYAVQWEGIRWAKQHGALRYDMWGVPDADESALEESFEARDDGLWGVYKFKRGFGGQVRRSVGAWDLVNNRAIYTLYNWYLRRGK